MKKQTKYILFGLGVVASAATAAYFIYKSKKSAENNDEMKLLESITSTDFPPPPSFTPGSTSTLPHTGFPIKKGSRGTKVKNLQLALIKTYGKQILPRFGADGHFGNETQSALSSNNLPTEIDQKTYYKIITGEVFSEGSKHPESNSPSLFSPSKLAAALALQIQRDDFNKVISLLDKIKNSSDYIKVNEKFKLMRINLVRKTLVTALLDQFNLESERKALFREFIRMGLKYSSGKWTLSGLGALGNLVTAQDTKVWNDMGQTMMVPSNTHLGTFLDAHDNATRFEAPSGEQLFVNTSHISRAL